MRLLCNLVLLRAAVVVVVIMRGSRLEAGVLFPGMRIHFTMVTPYTMYDDRIKNKHGDLIN